MFITPSVLSKIWENINLRYQQAYEAKKTYWQEIAMLVPSSNAREVYGWVGEIPGMREWLGPRVINNLAARGYYLDNKSFEDTISLARDSVADDQLGMLGNYAAALGEAAKIWPDTLVRNALEAGITELCYDGQFFFDSDHPIDIDGALGLGNFSNRFDSTTSGAMALSAANLDTGYTSMCGYKGESGELLGVRPTHLIVPPALRTTAKRITESDLLVFGGASAPESNPYKNLVQVLEIPALTSSTAWYLMDLSRPIKPLVFQQREAPVFEQQTAPDGERVFHQGQYIYGVHSRGAAGYALPFLAARFNT